MPALTSIGATVALAGIGALARELREPESRKRLAGLSTRDFGFRRRKSEGTRPEPQAGPVGSRTDYITDHPREYAAISAGSLAMALGASAVPVLGPLSLVPVAYAISPYLKDGIERAWHEKRMNVPVLHTGVLIGLAFIPSYMLLAIGTTTSLVSQYILGLAQRRTDGELEKAFDVTGPAVRVRRNGELLEVERRDIETGDILLLGSGCTIPVDGTVVVGSALVDTSKLTGEQVPGEAAAGDPVLSSGIILTGALEIRADSTGSETIAAKLLDVLQNGAAYVDTMKLEAEDFSDRTTPWIAGLAALTYPILGDFAAVGVMNSAPGCQYRATGPVGLLRASAMAARGGVLVKDCRALVEMATVDTVVFDKTGTLTTADMRLGDIEAGLGFTKAEVLSLAAGLEADQPHPIALAIRQAAEGDGLAPARFASAATENGLGVEGLHGNILYRIGSEKFLARRSIEIPEATQRRLSAISSAGNVAVLLAAGDRIAGILVLEPELRPEARATVSALKQAGLRTGMITGDRQESARAISAELGIEMVFADCMPAEKAALIEALQAEGARVCFVGDGINDTAAMRRANVSISFAGATELAADLAQVVISRGGLEKIATFRALSLRMERQQFLAKWSTILPPMAGLVSALTLGTGPWGSMVGQQSSLYLSLAINLCWKANAEADVARDTQQAEAEPAASSAPMRFAHARKIVEAFAATPDAGALQIDGQMIDAPHLNQAQHLRAQAAE